jgi:hypothetical protein
MKSATTFLLLTFAWCGVSQAANDVPFFQLASQYELDVKVFKKLAEQVQGIDRSDQQLVGRLETATKKLRLSAKNPRHQTQLFKDWQQVQQLHSQVEERFFTKYTPHHDLVQSWQAATYSYALFGEEVFYQVENAKHGNSVRRVQNYNALRSRYLGAAAAR